MTEFNCLWNHAVDHVDPIRIQAKIRIEPAGCWVWIGRTNPGGYGVYDARGTPHRVDGRAWLAHRLIYVLTHGHLDDAEHLHHECETPACVNPRHLKPVTPSEHRAEHRPDVCPAGHDMTDESNVRWRNTGRGGKARVCKACHAALARQRWLDLPEEERQHQNALSSERRRRRTRA